MRLTRELFNKAIVFIGNQKKERLFTALMSLLVAGTQTAAHYYNGSRKGYPFLTGKIGILEMGLFFLMWLAIALFCARSFFKFFSIPSETDREEYRFGFWTIVTMYMVFWMPYYIAFYPGLNTGDTARQVAMFFKLPTEVAGRECTNGINVLYSAHHSLFTTFLFGSVYQIGIFLRNIQLAHALYCLLQMFFCSTVFSWMIKTLREYGLAKKWRLVLFLYTAISPRIALYALNMCADTLYAMFTLLFVIQLTKLAYKPEKVIGEVKYLCSFSALMLLTILSKKQAIYVVTVTMLIYIFAVKETRRILCTVVLSVLLIYFGVFEGAVNRSLHVKPSGIQEMLSVPFQQTARFLREGTDEIEEEEINIVNRVIDVSKSREKYDPNIADPVKNSFRDTATNEDLKNYFKVWIKWFLRKPKVYFAAFIDGTYRYFDLSFKGEGVGFFEIFSVDKIYDRYKKLAEKYGFTESDYARISIESPKRLENAREKMKYISEVILITPVLSIIQTTGFCSLVTIAVFLCLFFQKRNAMCLPVLISLLNLCICLISPLNGSQRYSLPVVVAMPFFMGILKAGFKTCQE